MPDTCVHCAGTGWLLVEAVITVDQLTEPDQPPYWTRCHCQPQETR